jgi:hypothetical protein
MRGVEQDGLRTDERVPGGGWLERIEPTRPDSRIVLRTLLVADIGLLLVTGALFALFMAPPPGYVFGASCWGLAGALMALLRLANVRARRRGW